MKNIFGFVSIFCLMGGMAVAQEHMLPSNHGKQGVVEPISGTSFYRIHRLPSNHGEQGVVEPFSGNQEHRLPDDHGEQGVVEPIRAVDVGCCAIKVAEVNGKPHFAYINSMSVYPGLDVMVDAKVIFEGAPVRFRLHDIGDSSMWAGNSQAQEQNLITLGRDYFHSVDQGDHVLHWWAGHSKWWADDTDTKAIPPVIVGEGIDPTIKQMIDQGGLPPINLNTESANINKRNARKSEIDTRRGDLPIDKDYEVEALDSVSLGGSNGKKRILSGVAGTSLVEEYFDGDEGKNLLTLSEEGVDLVNADVSRGGNQIIKFDREDEDTIYYRVDHEAYAPKIPLAIRQKRSSEESIPPFDFNDEDMTYEVMDNFTFEAIVDSLKKIME